jgi:hypothetical protein
MTLRDFYLKRAKAEFPVFLKVLRGLPSDLSYKPDERSPSAENARNPRDPGDLSDIEPTSHITRSRSHLVNGWVS